MGAYLLYSYLASTLERQNQHINTTDLETMALHDVPNIHLRVVFRLCISINYTENVMELLKHVQTVDTRHSSPCTNSLGMML